MVENRKAVRNIFLSGAFLVLLSAYRQYYLYHAPQNRIYPWVVHIGYLALLLLWGVAVIRRISQRNLCLCFYGEFAALLLWEAVRFIQVTTLRDTLFLLQVSGYWIAFPIILTPLMGLYFALLLNRDASYRLSGRWYFLLFIAAALILATLTNEYHHWIFRRLPGEPEPNLYFHPNWGFGVLCLWIAALMLARTEIVFCKSRRNRDYPHLRYLPFCTTLLFVVAVLPHALSAFIPTAEIIELSAKLYFIEALVWESCILVGMIPVNRQYGQVFERSTVAMQITDPTGRTLVASRQATRLTPAQFNALRTDGHITLDANQELHLHKIPDGYLLWQKDLTQLHQILEEQQKIAEELAAEGSVLQEELRTQSQETKIQARSQIYDALSTEAQPQLDQLEHLLQSTADSPDKWRKVCLLGTYIKRLCNLRLIQQESGQITADDLHYSIEEYFAVLERFGIPAEYHADPLFTHRSSFFLHTLKGLQQLVEYTDFSLEKLTVRLGTCARLLAESQPNPRPLPPDSCTEGCRLHWQSDAGQVILVITEEAHVE